MISFLTNRDSDLLDCLTRRVPRLSFDRIVRVWWGASTSARAARKRLKFLKGAGLLVQRIVNGPCFSAQILASWRPDESPPDFAAILGMAQDSLTSAAVPIEVFEASKLA